MDIGNQIVRSSELIESVWMQAEALVDSLSKMMEQAVATGKLPTLKAAGPSAADSRTTPSGWSYTDYTICFPFMEPNKRKNVPTSWINFQISIAGDGVARMDEAGGASTGPLLHVSFWDCAIDFSEPAYYTAFPTSWEEWYLKHDRLVWWDSSESGKPQWTYSLRLLALANEATLYESVVQPVCALIAGVAVAKALPDTTPGLVFYTADSGGGNPTTLMPICR